jgi:hypothetical protein
VFVYGLHRELHDQIQFTGQLPFRSKIPDKKDSIKAFFTRIFRIPRLRDCRQISLITTKIDLLTKKLENLCLNHLRMVDAQVMCEECREQATWASTARRSPRISTLLVISTMIFVLIKASMLGETSPVSRSTTANRVVMGRISTKMSPLSEISLGSR